MYSKRWDYGTARKNVCAGRIRRRHHCGSGNAVRKILSQRQHRKRNCRIFTASQKSKKLGRMMNFGSGFRNFLVREQFVPSLKKCCYNYYQRYEKDRWHAGLFYIKFKKGCDAYEGIKRLISLAKNCGVPGKSQDFLGRGETAKWASFSCYARKRTIWCLLRRVSHLSKQGLCVPHAVPFTAENGWFFGGLPPPIPRKGVDESRGKKSKYPPEWRKKKNKP